MAKKIDYPVEIMPIVVIGKPGKWQRMFVVRTSKRGSFSLLIYPKGIIDEKYIHRVDFSTGDMDSEPFQYHYQVPISLRMFKHWMWEVVEKPAPDFNLGNRSSSKINPLLSTLLFHQRPVAQGAIALGKEVMPAGHKIIAWSCNQPFADNETELASLNEVVPLGVFDWYEKEVKKFDPSIIWALGDTAYSDGCKATNFIDQYYDSPGSLNTASGESALLAAYRRMYRSHWSFTPLQHVMRNYPHLSIWDDHEIRDGYGSEANDLERSNLHIKKLATKVAREYILNLGPRVRPEQGYHANESYRHAVSKRQEKDMAHDAHQAYVDGDIAAFIFDGRSSRKYADPGGKVISDEQLGDFESFCASVAKNRAIKYLILGTAVPFINLKDFLENLVSKTPKAITDLVGGMRDDVRDSWHSPGNIGQLKQLIQVLKRLHRQHSAIEIINISGDIHVANLYAFQPLGFTRALYQVTTSALSNREHPPDELNKVITVGTESWSEALGLVTRIWPTVSDPNFLQVEKSGAFLKLTLKVFDEAHWNRRNEEPYVSKDMTYEVGKHRFSFEHLLPV